jgi:hypothetical protein
VSLWAASGDAGGPLAGFLLLRRHRADILLASESRVTLKSLAQGNLDALERVWQLTDERGWTVDWRTVLASEGRHIAFA